MDERLILIVGLQKSGTTLLERLVYESGLASPAFDGEGDAFWGNEPPFAPRGYPAGAIYELHEGAFGHEANDGNVDALMRATLEERLESIRPATGYYVNKNPYNTLRLSWLRAIFRRACIVAMVRRPAPNIFSLRKKYISHEGRGLPPEEGWWGVRPRGWRDLVRDDVVEQCAEHWNAVNARLADDRPLVDVIIPYHGLCAEPTLWLQRIADRAARMNQLDAMTIPAMEPVPCFDDEYQRGGRLRSRNRDFRETESLRTTVDGKAEVDALSLEDLTTINRICSEVAGRLDLAQ